MEFKIPIVIDDKAFEEAVDKCVAKLKQGGDFVLVTRCKDCKHYSDGFCNHEQWFDDDNSRTVKENDFCSYAELKEIEGE